MADINLCYCKYCTFKPCRTKELLIAHDKVLVAVLREIGVDCNPVAVDEPDAVERIVGTIRTREKDKYIDDGFGNRWNRLCPNCGAELEIVRPGKVQCSEGCKQKET